MMSMKKAPTSGITRKAFGAGPTRGHRVHVCDAHRCRAQAEPGEQPVAGMCSKEASQQHACHVLNVQEDRGDRDQEQERPPARGQHL